MVEHSQLLEVPLLSIELHDHVKLRILGSLGLLWHDCLELILNS